MRDGGSESHEHRAGDVRPLRDRGPSVPQGIARRRGFTSYTDRVDGTRCPIQWGLAPVHSTTLRST
jgi:hypothetical protein